MIMIGHWYLLLVIVNILDLSYLHYFVALPKLLCLGKPNIPLQSVVWQTSASAGSPVQRSLPPSNVESLHLRSLDLDPWLHDTEHWVHSPHGCQVPVTAESAFDWQLETGMSFSSFVESLTQKRRNIWWYWKTTFKAWEFSKICTRHTLAINCFASFSLNRMTKTMLAASSTSRTSASSDPPSRSVAAWRRTLAPLSPWLPICSHSWKKNIWKLQARKARRCDGITPETITHSPNPLTYERCWSQTKTSSL